MRLGAGVTAALPDDVDARRHLARLEPAAPLLAQAVERGIPVWGEVELAWRLRDPGARRPGWP